MDYPRRRTNRQNHPPGARSDEIGLQAGDELLAINDNEVQDVIDVQFYSAEESLELLIRRGDEYLLYEAEREYGQLGLEFAHPTFNIGIRRCNNLCPFCFVLQMAPRFRRTLYIKDDDYRYSFLFGHFVTLTNLDDHDWWRIETMHLSPLYISVHVTDGELRRQFLRNDNAPDIMEQLRWLAERGIGMPHATGCRARFQRWPLVGTLHRRTGKPLPGGAIHQCCAGGVDQTA